MSNPYERLLNPSKPPPAGRRSGAKLEPSAGARGGQATSTTKPLSQATKRKPIEKPRNLSFSVRPRFRFDLPEPPMDPKMLLGKLSTASYARPFLSDLERDFRPAAIPSDPTYGLHANLVETSVYKIPAHLTFEDDALLQSVMAGRKGGDMLHNPDSKRSASQKAGVRPPPKPSDTVNAPWMRRMSYDEYVARDSTASRQSLHTRDAAAKKRVKEKISDPQVQERKRRTLLHSFQAVRRNLKHPDRRKFRLRPVSVAPILPDFASLGEELIALEFDKEDMLTFTSRVKKDPQAAEESLRSTATVSVAEPQTGGQERKYVAVYTPTNGTLSKRKRDREEDSREHEKDRSAKKIHFAENEMYQWIGEYSIREGKFGDTGRRGGLSRSCFAVTQYASEDGKESVACLTRIGTSWKLGRRAQLEGPGRLGKEGLMITRDKEMETGDDELKRDILSGVALARAAENREKKRKVEMLEED